MLIEFGKIKEVFGIESRGVIHVGMHKAEEYPEYKEHGVPKIMFIEANKELAHAWECDDPDCYVVHAAVSDKVEEVSFNITNNGQSSSILELGEHARIYPFIVFSDRIKMKTTTLDTIIEKVGVESHNWNILQIDIQGAELKAMKGLTDWSNVDAVITEVNYIEMYKDCPLIADIDEFLLSKDMVRVDEHDSMHGWGDALYVKKKFVK